MASTLRSVSLATISVSPLNARKDLGAGSEHAELAELAANIDANGLLHPPSVRDLDVGTFEVMAGQRRVLACMR